MIFNPKNKVCEINIVTESVTSHTHQHYHIDPPLALAGAVVTGVTSGATRHLTPRPFGAGSQPPPYLSR